MVMFDGALALGEMAFSAMASDRKFAVLVCDPSTVTFVKSSVGAALVVNFQVATLFEFDNPPNAMPLIVPVMEVVGTTT